MAAESELHFAGFRVDAGNGALYRDGVPVHIQPKPFALLLHLLRNRDRVVSKQELLSAVWPDVSVSHLALFSALRDLRRALGDTDSAERTIRTVRGQGIRFVADVAEAAPATPTVLPLRPAPAVVSSADFVGRVEPMTTLLGSLAKVRHGELRISFVAGAAGMGKTRLASELMRRATAQGVEVQIGRCIDREGGTAFLPWLELMRGLLLADGTASIARDTCASLAPLAPIAQLEEAGPSMERADLDRVEVRLRFFEAVGLLLERVSRVHPLLLVIDDLHWADEASLLLLEHLMTALKRASIHLVVAFRDAQRPQHTLARVLALGARHPFTERIDLQGLGREEVRALLHSAADKPPAPALVETILSATSGNALFVSELAKLAAHGELDVTGTQRGLPVPRRVRDVLRWQLDRLSPSCQNVLQALSVAAGPLPLAVLARAIDEAHELVLDALREAEVAGIAVAAPDADTSFGFAHDLVRESIYRDLTLAMRARLHRRMAQALEATTLRGSDADVGQIAYHYALGLADGTAEQAARFGYAAGQQANARMAYEDAVQHYDRALRACALIKDADPNLASEILLAQAEAAWGTSEDAPVVQRRFVVAADAARAARHPELFARAALGRSGHGVGPGDFREVLAIDAIDIALLTEANQGLGNAMTELRALVLARLALAVRYAKPFAVADELSSHAVHIAEAIGASKGVLAEVLRYRHEVLSGPNLAPERVRLAERILTLAREVGSRPLEIDALTFLARDHFETLDFAAAHAATTAVDALEASMKHPMMQFRGGIRRVGIAVLIGELGEAERLARQFYERDAARNIGALGTFELQTWWLAALRGDHQGALAALSDITAREKRSVPWADCANARELALSGAHPSARLRLEALAQHGFRNVTAQHELTLLGCYYLLAETCCALGHKAHASALYERMLPFEGMMAAPFLAAIWHGSMAHALGMLAALLEQGAAAERHFERALATANGIGSPPLIAQTSERFGALLASRPTMSERARGLELLSHASQIAERIGLRAVARGRDELGGARESVVPVFRAVDGSYRSQN